MLASAFTPQVARIRVRSGWNEVVNIESPSQKNVKSCDPLPTSAARSLSIEGMRPKMVGIGAMEALGRETGIPRNVETGELTGQECDCGLN